MHYHIIGETSNGELAIREWFGHETSKPPMERNMYKERWQATGALRRWRHHFMRGKEQIANCTLPCIQK